jgi:hypothetical protein
MIYVFKCENECCESFEQNVEVEQNMNDEHVADCEVCGQELKRVYTSFTIGVSQGTITKDGIKMPAKRAREIDRKREQKKKQGGEGPYWDNPNRRVAKQMKE